ncbi:unnamed protein product [Camellia sinensis]
MEKSRERSATKSISEHHHRRESVMNISEHHRQPLITPPSPTPPSASLSFSHLRLPPRLQIYRHYSSLTGIDIDIDVHVVLMLMI